jgi:DNA-binding MarR family transcriptional regulator
VALVQITTRGRRVQRRLREAQDEIFAERLTHWSQQDVSRLADLMERLAADLRQPEPGHRDAEKRHVAGGGS